MVEIKLHALAVVGVAGQAQQLVYALLLVFGVEQVACALLAGAARAANAVGVVLVFLRHVVVDDGVHVRNINATGGHVGGHQHADLTGLEPRHNAVALCLGQVAVQAVHVKVQARQLVGQHAGVVLGVAEDHHPLVPLADDDLRGVGQLVAAGGQQLVLGNFGAGFLHRLNVYFGGGVRSAVGCQPLRDLLTKADIPATYTLMAAGVLSYGEEHNLGLLGMHGCYTANKAIDEADLVIAVGTRFSDRVALNPDAFAKRAKIIQIDIDPSELGKNVDIDLSLTGDASYVLQAILPHVKEAKHADWMDQIHAWQAMDYKPVDSDTELKPHQIINEICEQAGPEAVYVTDVGQHQMWAAQYLHHTKSRGFLTSGGLGTMGFGYGAAIGAQMALGRDARVVMLTGDGSFHMNLNEGCTAVSYDLPIITVIFNNQVLGMVRQWQTTFYEKRYSDTDPHRKTDFVKLAEAFGAKGYRATTPAEFKVAFTDAMKQQGPSWIDCRIDKDEKVLPMIPGGGTIEDIIME